MPMRNPHSPLDDTHLQQINDAMKRIAVAEAQITLAKQAGIDVTQKEQQLEDSKKKLQQIKSVYFPGE